MVNLIFDYLHTPASAVTFYVKCCKSHINLISAVVEPKIELVVVIGHICTRFEV